MNATVELKKTQEFSKVPIKLLHLQQTLIVTVGNPDRTASAPEVTATLSFKCVASHISR
jgi:hypothetical protein